MHLKQEARYAPIYGGIVLRGIAIFKLIQLLPVEGVSIGEFSFVFYNAFGWVLLYSSQYYLEPSENILSKPALKVKNHHSPPR